MDLDFIISSLIGVISGGALSNFLNWRYNKKLKAAEVKKAEADVKRSENDINQAKATALDTMQDGYDKFTKDYMTKYAELSNDVENLKKTDQQKEFIINDLKRKTDGLTNMVGWLKDSLSEVEKIACIKIDCPVREPKLGEYKYKKES